MFVRPSGELIGMGANYSGELGDGTTIERDTPTQIVSGGVLQVSAGDSYSMFVKSDGSLWGMGDNIHGCITPLLDRDGLISPTMVIESEVQSVSAGRSHTLFRKIDGSLWGMGANNFGQLRETPLTDPVVPIQIESGSIISYSARSSGHSAWVREDGSLWTVGYGQLGQLGNNSTNITNPVPYKVVESGVIKVDIGRSHTAFIKTDGSLWVMGDASWGQVTGHTNILVPTMIVDNGVVDVSCGDRHTIFLMSDGSVWGMGSTWLNQVGEESYGNYYSPVQVVPSGSLVVGISAGNNRSILRYSDDTLWAVGDNWAGQLGIVGWQNIFSLTRIEPVVPPPTPVLIPNDLFTNALTIVLPYSSSNIALDACSLEPTEPIVGNMNSTVWYAFTAPTDGTLTISTANSPEGADTIVALYSGSILNSLVLVDWDDDSGGSYRSHLTAPIISGGEYRIQLGYYDVAPSGTLASIDVSIS